MHSYKMRSHSCDLEKICSKSAIGGCVDTIGHMCVEMKTKKKNAEKTQMIARNLPFFQLKYLNIIYFGPRVTK